MKRSERRIRFTAESRRDNRRPVCPLWARNSLVHRSKRTLFDCLAKTSLGDGGRRSNT